MTPIFLPPLAPICAASSHLSRDRCLLHLISWLLAIGFLCRLSTLDLGRLAGRGFPTCRIPGYQ